jgi:hypothetical protein
MVGGAEGDDQPIALALRHPHPLPWMMQLGGGLAVPHAPAHAAPKLSHGIHPFFFGHIITLSIFLLLAS